MINLKTITNIRYGFNTPNIIKFEYTTSSGSQKTAALSVPDGLGKNKEYDYIVEKYGYDFLENKLNEMKDNVEQQVQMSRLREEGRAHSQELAHLYRHKEKALNLFFIKENPDISVDIRSAPCHELVTCIMLSEYESYRKEHSLTHEQMSDRQEDFMYE